MRDVIDACDAISAHVCSRDDIAYDIARPLLNALIYIRNEAPHLLTDARRAALEQFLEQARQIVGTIGGVWESDPMEPFYRRLAECMRDAAA